MLLSERKRNETQYIDFWIFWILFLYLFSLIFFVLCSAMYCALYNAPLAPEIKPTRPNLQGLHTCSTFLMKMKMLEGDTVSWLWTWCRIQILGSVIYKLLGLCLRELGWRKISFLLVDRLRTRKAIMLTQIAVAREIEPKQNLLKKMQYSCQILLR